MQVMQHRSRVNIFITFHKQKISCTSSRKGAHPYVSVSVSIRNVLSFVSCENNIRPV